MIINGMEVVFYAGGVGIHLGKRPYPITIIHRLDWRAKVIELTIRLPASVHKEIKELAKAEGVSINQFLTLAAVEKISALRTLDYLREEASKGSRADFEAFLAAVPDDEPMEDDQM